KHINSNSVRFVMDNISLPSAEENLEGSYGFIHFKIDSKAVSGNKILVRNRAQIYIGSEEYSSSFYTNNTLVDEFVCEEGMNNEGVPIEPLTYEYGIVDSVCIGESGTLTIDFMEGFGSYKVEGTEIIGENFEENYTAGNYTINVSDSGNCRDSFEINIVEPEVNIEIEIEDTKCGNTNDGSIAISIDGNSGPYVTKYNGIPFESVLDDLNQDEYIIVVDDSWGCDYDNLVNVSGPSDIHLYTSTTDVTPENGMNGVIYIDSINGGTAPFTIEWDNVVITDSISNLAVGTYSLIVTDSLGCIYEIDVEVKLIDNITEEESKRITFYPNPFTEDIYIRCVGANCVIESISIYSLDGRLVSSLSANESNLRIPSSNFPEKGMYLIEVERESKNQWLKVFRQ
ncbi:T9SS type A sorting domain-containing protein, partial [Saprospiraceae bacterium]|nr:T9SS type A sorting domain-containing protein [Saprospiraceae bacterium]